MGCLPVLPANQLRLMVDLAMDYSDCSRAFTLLLGRCDETATDIVSKFTPAYRVEVDDSKGAPRVITLAAPAQVIPEIVRELAKENIAVYQVTPLAGGEIPSP